MKKTVFNLIVSLLVIAVGGGVYVALKQLSPKQPAVARKPLRYGVEAMRVTKQQQHPVQLLYGQIGVDNIQTLSAPSGGEVRQVDVFTGQWVRQGDSLVALDAQDYDLRIRSANTALAESESALDRLDMNHASLNRQIRDNTKLLKLQQRRLKRMKMLTQGNYSSEQQLEEAEQQYLRQTIAVGNLEDQLLQAKADRKILGAQIERARLEIQSAQMMKRRSHKIAGEDALIVDVMVRPGATVGAGTPLLKLIPGSHFLIEATLQSRQAAELMAALRDSRPVVAELSYLGVQIAYQLQHIKGRSSNGNIIGIFSPDRGQTEKLHILRPGVTYTMRLQRPPQMNALLVPFSALYGRNRIYQVIEGKLRRIDVDYLGSAGPPRSTGGANPWAVVHSDGAESSLEVMITHLPNAGDGLPVEIVRAR